MAKNAFIRLMLVAEKAADNLKGKAK